MSQWIYKDKAFDSSDIGSYVGFVYIITNNTNGKRYIGKKNFFFSKKKRVKGKNKRIKVESDWLDYYSSSDELKNDVLKEGAENFKREILHLCKTKSQMTYMELREQIDNRVLESNEWYNGWIMARVRKPKVPTDILAE